MRKIKTCDANEHAGFEVLSEAVGRPIKARLSTHEAVHKILNIVFNLHAQKSVQAHASLAIGRKDFYPQLKCSLI